MSGRDLRVGQRGIRACVGRRGARHSPAADDLRTPRLTAIIRQTQRAALAIADGGKAVWKIESGPAFARLKGSDLVISPAAADLGHYDLVVQASRDELTDSVRSP